LVVVALVTVRLVVVSPVMFALVLQKLVAVTPVEDAVVTTELLANTFCVKRLRNLMALDPSERLTSALGRISPDTVVRERDVVARVDVPCTLKSPDTVSLVEEALVEVNLVTVVVANVEVPVTANVPFEISDEVAVIVPKVAEPPVSVLMNPVTALKRVAKRLEDVAFVSVLLVAYKLVTVSPVLDAFPKVLCPVTFSVPLEVSDEVAVIEPPVKVLIVLVKAFRTDEKRLVEVALVRVEFVDVSPTMLARVLQKLVAVRAVEDAPARDVCPLTVRSVAVVVARVEVPDTVKLPYTEELPCDENPLVPIVSPPLAVILPLAMISLRTERLPASSEWIIAEVDSMPPRSRIDIVLAP
jgi:hypothetical protein